jgi:pimeloyl-ACP methyl ester carboxylesterase
MNRILGNQSDLSKYAKEHKEEWARMFFFALLGQGAYSLASQYFNSMTTKNSKDQYNMMLAEYYHKQRSSAQFMLRRMPFDWEYAVLAQQVYLKKPSPPPNWEEYGDSDKVIDSDGNSMSRSGFFAATYVNKIAKVIAIVPRGTTEIDNYLTDIRIVFNEFDRSHICADVYAEHTLQKIKSDKQLDGYSVVFVGHSLGALHAQLLAYQFNTTAITFDGPGAYELLKKKAQGAALDEGRLKKLRSYLSRPNYVNTAGKHVGERIRIYPVMPLSDYPKSEYEIPVDQFRFYTGILFLNILTNLNKLYDKGDKLNKELSYYDGRTKYWHSIALIVDTLKHEIYAGVPVKQRTVKSWPHNISQYKEYLVIAENCDGLEPDELSHTVVGQINSRTLREVAHYEVEDLKVQTSSPSLSHVKALEPS